MDMMAMVTSMLAMQAGNTQTQIGTAILKSDADAQKSAVQTLLGGPPSIANLGAGVGGNLNITA
jgi:Putative motility protein